MTRDIRELSFVSVQPLSEIPYFYYSIRLKKAIEVQDIKQEVGRIARQLKYDNNRAVIADTTEIGLFSPLRLTSTEDYEILDEKTINLANVSYQNALLQMCNYQLLQAFRKAKSSPKIDVYHKRIYSQERQVLSGKNGKVEAQRYLNFNFAIDDQNHLILALDFANEYQSHQTLDQIGLEQLKKGDRLLHTYDGKSCEFVSISTNKINTILPELGNKSLIQYHQEKNHVLPPNLDINTFGIKVIYKNSQGNDFEAEHIPQLLKRIFDRSKLEQKTWENQLLPIQRKAELASDTMRFINGKFLINQNQFKFHVTLRKPKKLLYLLQDKKSYNLDFGQAVVSYPTAALGKGYLLEKPSEIKVSILYPSFLDKQTKQYLDKLKDQFNNFEINLLRHWETYNPNSDLEINQKCQTVKDCDFVIAIVPDSEEKDYNSQINPYKRLKNQLIPRRIPSQMIQYQTVRKGWNKFVGYNLILGINAKLGYMNWKLKQLQGNTQAFIGLDIGRKEGKAIGASAFLLNGEAQLLGWSNTELTARKETFDTESLRNLIIDLFSLYTNTYQTPLQHLVIHRDGDVNKTEYRLLCDLATYLKPQGLINLDIVEVIKKQTCRALQFNQNRDRISYTNPDKGYVWEHCPNEAIILTTGTREAKVSPNSSPRPLRIRKRLGNSDLLLLAEQVYWLSEMQVGSTQTIRLPITTYYADRAAECTLNGLLPKGLHCDRHLWFL